MEAAAQVLGMGPASAGGYSVTRVGDMNGDGLADYAIGAPGSNGDSGAVYVIYAAPSGLPFLDLHDLEMSGRGLRIDGMVSNGRMGAAVASAGDVNGDGFADIIVGAPGEGITYLFFGRPGGFASGMEMRMTALRINGGLAFGYSVAGIGDLNGDGVDDVAIGAGVPNVMDGSVGCVVFGTSTLLSGSWLDCGSLGGFDGFRLRMPFDSTAGSFTVAAAGDLDGSGRQELVVGSPDEAKVYVVLGFDVYGPELALSTYNFYLQGPIGSRFGQAVVGGGDLNGDGIDDLVIGAPFAATDAGSEAGVTFVAYGGPFPWFQMPVDASTLQATGTGYELRGNAAFEHTGWSVAFAGDLNHDGRADVAIGAPDAGYNGEASGAVYVAFGVMPVYEPMRLCAGMGPGCLDGDKGFQVIGMATGDRTGWSVTKGGDFNGDGADDLFIGAPGANVGSGVMHVVYGAFDSDPPGVSMAPSVWPNAYGWNNTPVTFSVHADDGLYGTGVQETRIAVDPGTAPHSFDALPATWVDPVFTTEGVHWVFGAAMDRAGNKGGPVGYTAKIDLTPPRVKITGVVRQATYTLGNVPIAGCKTTDALSGVATSATVNVTGGRLNGTGTFTVTCSGALDKAGNAGSATLKYYVVK